MTHEHLAALLLAADAKAEGDVQKLPEGRHITLHLACGGVSLSVGKVVTLRQRGALLEATTVRGEIYVLALEDIFAGAAEAPSSGGRKAGFL